jgi:uncharacterized protein (DUF952 family)
MTQNMVWRIMDMVFHICPREDWEAAQQNGEYKAGSLENEGFIHCSKVEQIAGVANAFYKGIEGLVLLHIAPDKLQVEVRGEEIGGEVYPHIYGPVNLDAVVEVEDFKAGQDGKFVHP